MQLIRNFSIYNVYMLLILIQRKLIPHDFDEIKICIKNNNLLVYIP